MHYSIKSILIFKAYNNKEIINIFNYLIGMSAKEANSVSNSNPTYSDCHFSDVDLRSLIESVWATKIYTKNPKSNDKNN